jgi:hypothetical protein
MGSRCTVKNSCELIRVFAFVVEGWTSKAEIRAIMRRSISGPLGSFNTREDDAIGWGHLVVRAASRPGEYMRVAVADDRASRGQPLRSRFIAFRPVVLVARKLSPVRLGNSVIWLGMGEVQIPILRIAGR